MGHRAKTKNNPTPIYRSRQAGRTDIEELLGPAFNPQQRPTGSQGEITALPRPENLSDQTEQTFSSLKADQLTPVVGSGVGNDPQPAEAEQNDLSKLVQNASPAEPSSAAQMPLSTVVNDSGDSGSGFDLPASRAADENLANSLITDQENPMTTVVSDYSPDVISNLLSTVDSGDGSAAKLFLPDAVNREALSASFKDLETGDIPSAPYPLSTVPSEYEPLSRWITEQGQAVSGKQVRPFKMAQEALNSNERVLYTVLWNNKEAKIDPNHPHVRTVRAGYDYLARQTNLAKKTIQRLIPRLMQKDFIQLEETPDFYNRVAASYRVFSYKHVLETAAEQGRTHVAKLGHGVAFVKQHLNYVPVEDQHSPATVVSDPLATVVQKSTVSVPSPPLPTVVRKSTLLESRSISKGGTTTAPPELYEKLETLIPEIDTGAVERIWREGREVMADIQPEEIAYWFGQRAELVYKSRGLKNPLGFLLSSVRDWLTERKVMNRRKELLELTEEEQKVREQLEKDQHAWKEKLRGNAD